MLLSCTALPWPAQRLALRMGRGHPPSPREGRLMLGQVQSGPAGWFTCAGETLADLAAGFGVGTAAAWRP
jgi:hypothetical protein